MLLSCFYNFLLKNKFNFINTFLLIVILILASINIFYQSKLNILAFIICCFYIFLSNNNYKNKLKILSLVLLITLPFIINFAYEKYYNKNYNFIQSNRLFSNDEGFFIFRNNERFFIFNNDQKKKYDYKDRFNINDKKLNELCFSHNTAMDRFFGGRICGWEILTKLYFSNFELFGYGFYNFKMLY